MLRLCLILCVALVMSVPAAFARAVDVSLRPAVRPASAAPEGQTEQAQAVIAPRPVRPLARPNKPVKTRSISPEVVLEAAAAAGFRRWTVQFRGRAIAAGITPQVFDAAFRTAAFDPSVIERDRNQSEFIKPIWLYLDSAASDKRITNGTAALSAHAQTLDAIEAKYGVEKEVVVAVWGLESSYGSFRGDFPVISALATLAYEGRRRAFFETQLLAALKILQAGDIAPEGMTGSWAGAMGHTQFMPTSYLDYAVDFTGDGKRDIWMTDPTDALASTAAYLKRFGWQSGMPWGFEVTLPSGFDYTLANRKVKKSLSDWKGLGLKRADGEPMMDHGAASVLLPAGARGAAFLVFKNFAVIERYNAADAYVIGVGHLADRLMGKGPIRADWPREDRALTFTERKEMQRRLTSAGFRTFGIDGKIGPRTVQAIRAFQRAKGVIPDGYASLALLSALRG